MWANRKPLQRGEHSDNCLFLYVWSWVTFRSALKSTPCVVGEWRRPAFQGKSEKLKKSSCNHPELCLQDSLRLANRSTMGICIFIDKWSTRQAVFGERKEGVNRHSTEIVAKKMWRRSSHVLRPKKVAEDSNCWRPAILAIQRRRASKTGEGPGAEVGKRNFEFRRSKHLLSLGDTQEP